MIGVVIVSYKTPELLRKAVDSIYKVKELKVKIVDNSPKESECYKEADKLARRKNVSVIHTEKNIFHGDGLNLGIENLDTEYVIVMDSDAELLDESIIPMLIEKLNDDNVYAAGASVEHVAEGNERYGVKFDYLRPFFAMFKREMFYKYYPFVHHGAPWCQTMIDIRNEKRVEGVDEWEKYVFHKKQATIKVANGAWFKGWHNPKIEGKDIKPFVIKREYYSKLSKEYEEIRRLKGRVVPNKLAVSILKKKPAYIAMFESFPQWYKR